MLHDRRVGNVQPLGGCCPVCKDPAPLPINMGLKACCSRHLPASLQPHARPRALAAGLHSHRPCNRVCGGTGALDSSLMPCLPMLCCLLWLCMASGDVMAPDVCGCSVQLLAPLHRRRCSL